VGVVALNGGDRLYGPLFLEVVDAETGETLHAGGVCEDMDIDPKESRLTIVVNTDVGYDP